MTSRSPGVPRLRILDLLRFVAAVMVMLHHYVGTLAGFGTGNHHNMPVISQITHFGYLGVDLFFLISGFVILMSAWGRGVGEFAVSRVTRLFPAYWFGVTLAVIVFLAMGYKPEGADNPIAPYLPNMTMLQQSLGMPHMEIVYWTLWIELHFYVLMAALVWRGITYRGCVAFMVGWLLLSVFATEADSTPYKLILMAEWAPYFIAGMAFYLIYRFGGNLVLWLIAAACWALAINYRLDTVTGALVWPGVGPAVLTGMVTFLFLLLAMVATHQFDFLEWRGFTVLGALTYPLYLVHLTVGRALIDSLDGRLGKWGILAVSCAAALFAAYLVRRFVEEPAQHWMRPRLKALLVRLRQDLPALGQARAPSRQPAEPVR